MNHEAATLPADQSAENPTYVDPSTTNPDAYSAYDPFKPDVQPPVNPALDPHASVEDLQASFDRDFAATVGYASPDAKARAAAAADPEADLRYQLYGDKLAPEDGSLPGYQESRTRDISLDDEIAKLRHDAQTGKDRADEIAATEYAKKQEENARAAEEIVAAPRREAYNNAYYDELARMPAKSGNVRSDGEVDGQSELFANPDQSTSQGSKQLDLFDYAAEQAGESAAARHDRAVEFATAHDSDNWTKAQSAMDGAYREAQRTGNWDEFDGMYDKLRGAEQEKFTTHVNEVEGVDALGNPIEAETTPVETGGRHAAPDDTKPGDRPVLDAILAKQNETPWLPHSHATPEAEAQTPQPDGFRRSDSDSYLGPDDDSDIDVDLDGPAADALNTATPAEQQPAQANVGSAEIIPLDEFDPNTKDGRMPEGALAAHRQRGERLYGGGIVPPAVDQSPKGLRERLRSIWYNAAARLTTSTKEERWGAAAVVATVVGGVAAYYSLKHGDTSSFTAVGPGHVSGAGGNNNPGLLANIPPSTGGIASEAAATAAGAINKTHHLVSGFNPNVPVAPGDGFDKVIGHLVAQKGVHLTGAQEHDIFSKLHAKYGDNIFEQRGSSYHMANGGLGISAPGAHEVNHGVLHDLDRLVTDAIEESGSRPKKR